MTMMMINDGEFRWMMVGGWDSSDSLTHGFCFLNSDTLIALPDVFCVQCLVRCTNILLVKQPCSPSSGVLQSWFSVLTVQSIIQGYDYPSSNAWKLHLAKIIPSLVAPYPITWGFAAHEGSTEHLRWSALWLLGSRQLSFRTIHSCNVFQVGWEAVNIAKVKKS